MRNLTLTIALVLISCDSPSPEAISLSHLLTADGIPPHALDEDLSTLTQAPLGRATPTSSDSLEVISALASCALPNGASVTDALGHELLGDIGLAPDWVRRALDRRERRWVIACLAARISLEGLVVPVSLRAPHKLSTVPGESEVWTLMEGGFGGEGLSEMSACSGVGHHPDRLCAVPDPANPRLTLCGFRYVGPCGVACRVRDGVLRGCSFGHEVITVYDLSP